MHASLQRKFSFSYIAIILAVLILLNTYPLITSENLTFRSKQSSLQGSVSVMVTALSGLEELSEENVAGAMTLVEETGISRVLVTDASGARLTARSAATPFIRSWCRRFAGRTSSTPNFRTRRSKAARPRRSSTTARPSARSTPMNTTPSKQSCCCLCSEIF